MLSTKFAYKEHDSNEINTKTVTLNYYNKKRIQQIKIYKHQYINHIKMYYNEKYKNIASRSNNIYVGRLNDFFARIKVKQPTFCGHRN